LHTLTTLTQAGQLSAARKPQRRSEHGGSHTKEALRCETSANTNIKSQVSGFPLWAVHTPGWPQTLSRNHKGLQANPLLQFKAQSGIVPYPILRHPRTTLPVTQSHRTQNAACPQRVRPQQPSLPGVCLRCLSARNLQSNEPNCSQHRDSCPAHAPCLCYLQQATQPHPASRLSHPAPLPPSCWAHPAPDLTATSVTPTQPVADAPPYRPARALKYQRRTAKSPICCLHLSVKCKE
jgi:hypothetical protein